MRLFTAVELDPATKDNIDTLTAKLKPCFKSGNFTLKDNFHLTLVFIGETQRSDAIKSAMDAVRAQPFMLTFDKTGAFSRRDASTVWLGAAYEKELFSVHGGLTQKLAELKFDTETRKYTPHLTLCRNAVLKAPLPTDNINISQRVTHISLMQSERDAFGILKYTCLYKKYL